MRTLSNIKIKVLPFSISILLLSLLIVTITSCSSNNPTDEMPPVAEDIKLINRTSHKIWRDGRERYLKSVGKILYEEEGITNLIIESNQGNNKTMTVDKEIFLVQSCEHGNKQACEFIQSLSNQF